MYDDRGNLIQESYYGLNGKPALQDGYALIRDRYDDAAIESRRIPASRANRRSVDGDARTVVAYDARGNIASVLFRPRRQADVQKNGYARRKLKFDARGNPIEETYFDVNGEPTLSETGSAKVTRIYDSSGNPIEERHFGIDGLPALVKDGYAATSRRYDARGNQVEQSYSGPDGKPILMKSGYATVKRRYDSFGNQTEIAFLDAGRRVDRQQRGASPELCASTIHGAI